MAPLRRALARRRVARKLRIDSWRPQPQQASGAATTGDAELAAARAPRDAVVDLKIDFAFVVAYSAALFVSCLWASAILRPSWIGLATIGLLVAYCQLIAGLLDVVENVTLLRELRSPLIPDSLPELARWAAQAKFALIGLGVAYSGAGLVKYLSDVGGTARLWILLVVVVVGMMERKVVKLLTRPPLMADPATQMPVSAAR